MNIIALDFETYWSLDYTLSRMTTEEYVRDPRFHAQMIGIAEYDTKFNLLWEKVYPAEPLTVDSVLTQAEFSKKAALVHHAHFDGLILSHHYGARPARWYDTLSMARAVHGSSIGNSLSKLAEFYGIGRKGDELMETKGIRDLSPYQFKRLAQYCINDVHLSVKLFQKMLHHFTRNELMLIDKTVRMFTEPSLELDKEELSQYLLEQKAAKADLLLACGASKDVLMSNDKFAALLESFGVAPPMKISPATGKPSYAFAKTDEKFLALAEHPSEEVQAIVAARLGNKSTINETRAERMLGMANRGKACIYLKYCGAEQTTRHSGADKMNWQNLTRGSRLRKAIKAPKGMKLVVGDSANIEARVLPALAGQHDIIQMYREGQDLYSHMATKIFGHLVRKDQEDNPNWKKERFIGKTAVLGLGYGMGADKFFATVKLKQKGVTQKFSQLAVDTFREGYHEVVKLWKECDNHLSNIQTGQGYRIGKADIPLYTEQNAIRLPNGLRIRYPNLRKEAGKRGAEWVFDKRKQKAHIYGGKVVENIVQALARIVVMEQTTLVGKKWKVMPLLVHDEIVLLVPADRAEEAAQDLRDAMNTPPTWWPDLPVGCDVHFGDNYLDAKPE